MIKNLTIPFIILFSIIFQLLTIKPSFSAQPKITFITPTQGATNSTQDVTIEGSDFDPDARVSLLNEGQFDLKGYKRNQKKIKAIDFSNNYAYLLYDDIGLQIIDIRNPQNSMLIGSKNSNFTKGDDIYISGNYAYIASDFVNVFDISTPNNPTLAASIEIDGSPKKIFKTGNYIYVCNNFRGNQTFTIIDISDLENPIIKGTLSDISSSVPTNIIVSKNHVYLTFFTEILIINISDPTNPFKEGEYLASYEQNLTDFFILGDLAYVTDGKSLMVFNITIPYELTLLGTYDTPGNTKTVKVIDNFAYITDQNSIGSWLLILDITDPKNIILIDAYSGFDELASKLHFLDNFIYMATTYGFTVFWVNPPVINVNVLNSNTITATFPAALSIDFYDVVVKNPFTLFDETNGVLPKGYKVTNSISKPNIYITDTILPIDDLKLPFGSVAINSTSSKTFTITNTGNANLIIGDIGIVDTISPPFKKIIDNCSNKQLSPTNFCSLTILFSPSLNNSSNDTFDIPSNDSNKNSVIVNLSGTGSETPIPDISITDSTPPSFYDLMILFTDLTENLSAIEIITIKNEGNSDLHINQIAKQDNIIKPFSITPDFCSNHRLSPSETCILSIQFNPAMSGTFSDTFDIVSDDPDEPSITVSIAGKGLSSANNNPPSPPLLSYPAHEQTGLPTSLDFIWKKSTDPDGDPVTYTLYYCDNPIVTNCSPVSVTLLSSISKKTYFASISGNYLFILICMIILGSFRRKFTTEKKILIIFLVMGEIFFVSCSDNNYNGNGRITNVTDTVTEQAAPPSRKPDEAGFKVTNLNKNTTYYWRVIAEDNRGASNPSEIKNFSTQE